MKIFFNIVVILILANSIKAQNLVPNPSFEFVNNPHADQEFFLNDTSFENTILPCWALPLTTSAVYISSYGIDTIPNYSLPFHEARTGMYTSMIWLAACRPRISLADSLADERAYLQTRLIYPLTAGQAYTFTMYVSGPPLQFIHNGSINCYRSGTSARNLGVSISATRPFSTSIIYLHPQLNFNGISFVSNRHTWIQLTATYIASGGELYLTIGNFDSYPNTVFETPFNPPPCPDIFYSEAYLFLDDISLVPIGITDTTASYLNIGNDTDICSTTPVNLNLTAQTGFYTYLWNTGETGNSIHVTAPGTYYCSVGTSCSVFTDTIKITSVLNNSTGFTLGNDTSVCDNAPFIIPLQVPATFDSYQWNTGANTPAINATAAGTYWVKVIYPCGEISDTIVIHSIPSHYAVTLGNDTTICNNGSFSVPLTATGGFSNYTWNTGAVTSSINISSAGTYWIKADSTCGVVSDTIQVSSQPYLSLNLGNDTAKCADGIPFTLTASPGFTFYTWSTGAHTQQITAATTGTYYVSASYYCGTLSDTIHATINPIPAPPASTDTILCLNDPFVLHAPGQNILWYASFADPAGSTISPIVNTAVAGQSFFYTTQTINSCTSNKALLTVNVITAPDFELGESKIICPDQQISIGPNNTMWSYLWNDSITYSPRTAAAPADYIVTAGNSCGIFTDSLLITIDDCDCHVYVPNAFTPNNDGLNDVFKPGVDCDMQTYQLRIFDRWGELVFQANNSTQGWNGQYKGKLCEQDVYVVQIIYQGKHSNTKVLTDKVVLVQ